MSNRQPFHLRILGTTDLHMHIQGWNYYTDRPARDFGLSRLSPTIQSARFEVSGPNATSLLFDNGDSLQGTPLDQSILDPEIDAHPMMAAFRALEYDAIGLGNHDFNFGLPALKRVLEQAPCPVICSNVDWPGKPELPVVRSIVLERTTPFGALKIGVLSVLPPQTADWDKHLLEDRLSVSGIFTAARRTAKDLRQSGAHVVVALAHTGFGEPKAFAKQENALLPLATIADVDAVIAGHAHQVFPGSFQPNGPDINNELGLVGGTPVVMAGSAASWVGVIDLWLEREDDGSWKINETNTELRAASTATEGEDETLLGLSAKAHDKARDRMRKPIGRLRAPMQSYFSLAAYNRGLSFVAGAQAWALRRLLDGTEYEKLPILSAAAPAKCGGRNGPLNFTDIPKGEISRRHIFDLYLFPNELRAVVMSGAQLFDWLEVSASLFNTVPPSTRGAALIENDTPSYNFDIIHGLVYEIDITEPPRFDHNGQRIGQDRNRVRNIEYQGKPVGPDDLFAVALNNYRLNGGGNIEALIKSEMIPLPPKLITDLLENYLMSGETDPIESAPAPWRLAPAPAPGATVRMRTGPNARAYLPGTPFREVGVDADGFLVVEFDL